MTAPHSEPANDVSADPTAEVPEADSLEQQQDLSGAPLQASTSLEADEGDVLEQASGIDDNDEDYPHSDEEQSS